MSNEQKIWLLKTFISDIEITRKKLDEGDIDVYQFYEEVMGLNEFYKNLLDNESH
jgi:hypothetical protein